MILDIISDIHLDFYVEKDKELIKAFIEKLLNTKTDKVFDILVIAGDLGHYNDDNVYFLKEISKYYKKVFVTWGNHDLYLVNDKEVTKYNYNSFNRLKDLKEKLTKIENLVFLDGEKIKYNEITFWGSGLWYDVLNITHWANYMNDARYIYDTDEPYKIVMPYDYYPTT
jgi:predicted MPP superfamily phosphohydrolase